jgi:glycosyltransferase involved in cell wall biosynthesis
MRTLAVDALRMVGARTAMGRYIEHLAYEWSRTPIPFDRVILLAPRPVDLPPLGNQTEVVVETFGGRMPHVAWEQVALPRRARQLAVLFCPSYIAPVAGRTPTVVANHGIYERIPDEFSRIQRLRSTSLHRMSARRAQRTIANSLNTRADIVDVFGVRPDRVDVVYPAANRVFFERHNPQSVRAEVARVLGADARYFIFVGKLSRRRHVPELVEAFARIRSTESPHHRLLIVGPNTMGLDIDGLARRHALLEALTYVPHLEQDSLALLYAGADAFVLPTTYEGISHTMFEAMASGTAVLTVDHPTLAEGAGNAAFTLPTPSVDHLYEGMQTLLTDENLRRNLASRGLARAAAFSWRTTAQRTVDILDRVAAPADAGSMSESRAESAHA